MTGEITMKEIGEMFAFIVKHMATKDDIAELNKKYDELARKQDATNQEVAEVKEIAMATASELAIVRRDVEEIKETVESHNGFAKEIDHTMDRVGKIEKHLGMATV
jgi:uncharacterized coiled-coil DUF342 family protein